MSGRIADFDEPPIPAPTDEERKKGDVLQRGWPGELLAAAWPNTQLVVWDL
jgi:hypothetical protein